MARRESLLRAAGGPRLVGGFLCSQLLDQLTGFALAIVAKLRDRLLQAGEIGDGLPRVVPVVIST